MQRQPGAVVAPVETWITRAVGSPSARSPTTRRCARPRPATTKRRPSGCQSYASTPARQRRRPGLASPPSTSITYSWRPVPRSDRNATAGRRARTAASDPRRRRSSADAAGRRSYGTSQIAHRSGRRRVVRRVYGDELAVRGERHLAERDLPAQVGRLDHAMTSTCGAAAADPPRAPAPSSASRSRPRSGRASARGSSAAAATARARARRGPPGSCRTGRPVGSPRTRRRRSGEQATRESTRKYQSVGLADHDVDEDRHEHHPEQKRGAAADVDARVLRAPSRASARRRPRAR